MIMEAAEILRGAAREVEKGWRRNSLERDGKVCSLGALRRAAGLPLHGDGHLTHHEYSRAVDALAKTLAEQYPEHDFTPWIQIGSPESAIWRYNDDAVPSGAAAAAVMEKAANSLEA